jgi:hypothetical protein
MEKQPVLILIFENILFINCPIAGDLLKDIDLEYHFIFQLDEK